MGSTNPDQQVQTNSRNGYTQKKLQGEFEPQMGKKEQSRLSGQDEKIMTLYAQGMSVRDIQVQL